MIRFLILVTTIKDKNSYVDSIFNFIRNILNYFRKLKIIKTILNKVGVLMDCFSFTRIYLTFNMSK